MLFILYSAKLSDIKSRYNSKVEEMRSIRHKDMLSTLTNIELATELQALTAHVPIVRTQDTMEDSQYLYLDVIDLFCSWCLSYCLSVLSPTAAGDDDDDDVFYDPDDVVTTANTVDFADACRHYSACVEVFYIMFVVNIRRCM